MNSTLTYKGIKNKLFTFLGVLLKSGSDMLRLCNDLRLLPSVDADVINEDIAIVDWLVDTRAPLDRWSCSLCWSLLWTTEGVGGGKPPTTRWAVLSKKLSNLPTSFARAKLVVYPPYIWCDHYNLKRVIHKLYNIRKAYLLINFYPLF